MRYAFGARSEAAAFVGELLHAEVPALSHLIPPVVPGFVMQTPLQTGILVSDVPGPTGGIMLTTASGAMILINELGITLSNGQGASIQMTGPLVNINEGALTIE